MYDSFTNFNLALLKIIRQKLSLSKRQKIVIATTIITIGLMYTQLVSLFVRTKFIFGFAILTFLISLWALREGMNRIKAITLLLLPTLFALGVSSFYFLLPLRWLTRLPVDGGFALSMYFLLLSQNVFNVASSRTIPLYRAASTVAFVYTIATAILLLHILHAFSLNFIWNGVAAFAICFLLSVPVLWSVEMEGLTGKILIYSLILSLSLGEFALVLSFWPIPSNSLMWAIALSSLFFILLGICLDYFRDRLSRREVYLYLGFGSLVATVTTLTSSWTG